jgi:L-aminopeptidase/D-esterase-like protein
LDSGFPLEPPEEVALRTLSMVPWNRMDPFFAATVHAVEEAVLNALVNNADMTGRAGHYSPALPHNALPTHGG